MSGNTLELHGGKAAVLDGMVVVTRPSVVVPAMLRSDNVEPTTSCSVADVLGGVATNVLIVALVSLVADSVGEFCEFLVADSVETFCEVPLWVGEVPLATLTITASLVVSAMVLNDPIRGAVVVGFVEVSEDVIVVDGSGRLTHPP